MHRVQSVCAVLDHWHWALLVVAMPFLLFPSPSRSPAMLIVPVLWIISRLAGRELLPRTPLNLVLLVMFVMVLISEWATFDLAWSLPKIAGMILGIGIYFALVRYGKSPCQWWGSLLLFIVAGFGISVLALFGTQWSTKISFLAPIFVHLVPRITGLPGSEVGWSANELAGVLVWVAPLMLNLGVLAWVRRAALVERLGWGQANVLVIMIAVGSLFVTVVLILTQSRGGYLGFAITELLILFVALPRRGKMALGGLGGLVLAASVLWAMRSAPMGEISRFLNGDAGGGALNSVGVLGTAEGRLEVWSRGIYGIQDFPFTGMGMNNFRRVAPVLYPFFLIGPDVDIAHAHNEFLQAALDLGIPGLIAFLALYLGVFWMLFEIWRAAPNTPTPTLLRTLVLGFGGGLFAHIVYSMTDAVTLGAKPGFLFWMLLGLIAGLFDQVHSRRITEWTWWHRLDTGMAI